MSSKAVAFFTGLGAGLLDGQEALDKKARQKKLDAQADAEFDARQKDRALAQQERQAVAAAGAPLTVNTNAATLDASGKPVLYEVGGVQYPDLPSAQKAVAEGNTPDGTALRQATALAGINPERGARMRSDVRQGQAAEINLQNARLERARKMKEEGLFDGLRAFRQGDAKGMVDAFNKGGQFKIDGQVTMEPEVREIPEYGEITTYNATFNVVGPDGKTMPMKINSHDYSMQAIPYEKMLAEMREGVKTAAEANKDNATAEYYRGAKTAAAAGKAVAEKPYKMDEDDKLRFQEANKGLQAAEKALNDAMSKLTTGDDPTKNPAVAHAQGLVKQAKANQLKTAIRVGALPLEDIAADVVATANGDVNGIARSLTDLANFVGPETSDKVFKIITVQNPDLKFGQVNVPTGAPKTPQGKAIAKVPNEPTVTLQPDGSYAAPKPAARSPQPVAAVGVAGSAGSGEMEAAGQRLDVAREQLRALGVGPGLASGRAAMDAHAAKVAAAKQAVAQAEAEYLKLVPTDQRKPALASKGVQ